MEQGLWDRRRRYRAVMLAACFAAFALVLWNVRHQYFVWDEWSYWTERQLALDQHRYADFFLQQHVGHWHGIVMLVWLPIDAVVGAKSYLPYIIPTIVTHCVGGFLLFELLCHTRIRPGVAATTAGLSLVLASAAGDISFAWQLCFVAPLALCFLALLAVERYSEGGPRWLAVVTVVSVMVSIASSNVGITVMLGVAALALARRRFAFAATIMLTGGGEYLVWRHYYKPQFFPFRWALLGDYLTYARTGLESTAEGMMEVHVSALGWMLLAAAVASVAIAIIKHDPYWPVYAVTLGAAVFFFASLSTQRYFGESPSFSAAFSSGSLRYRHVGSVLLLPSLAYFVNWLVSVRRWVAVVAIAFVSWALFANTREFLRLNDPYVAEAAQIRSDVSATVALGSSLDTVPGSVQPFGLPAFGLSIADVRRLAHDGKLPCNADATNVHRMAVRLHIPLPLKRAATCK